MPRTLRARSSQGASSAAGAAPPRSRSSPTRSSPAARAASSPPTTTRSPTLARSLRSHGMSSGTWSRHTGDTDSYDVVGLGFNYRLDEPRSALLLSRLPRLEHEIERRRELTRALPREARPRSRTSLVPYEDADVERSSCYVMAILVDDDGRRDAVRRRLLERSRRPDVGLLPGRAPARGLPRPLRRAAPPAHRARRAHRDHAPALRPPRRARAGPRRRRPRRGARGMSWTSRSPTSSSRESDRQAVAECLEGGWLTMGPRTRRFEAALGRAGRVRRTPWTVSSGTAALHLACRALELGPGDEVVVPALTFIATANAARYTGAEPVLCDVESPERPNLDADAVERCLSPRTRAVIAVHLAATPSTSARCASSARRAGSRSSRMPPRRSARRSSPDGRPAPSAASGASRSSPRSSSASARAVPSSPPTRSSPRGCARCAPTRMTSGTWDRHTGHAASYDVIDVGYNYRLDEPRAALGMARLTRLSDDIESPPRRRPPLPRGACRHARPDAHVDRRGRRAQLALRVPGAVRQRQHAPARARRAREPRHPDDPLPRAAHAERARAAAPPRAPCRRPRRPPTGTSRCRSRPTRTTTPPTRWRRPCATRSVRADRAAAAARISSNSAIACS